MIKKTLFIIPARGGSKGVPGKNIKLLNGKPLILHTIDIARKLTNDENICVSTDDLEYIQTIEEYGLKVPFKRPHHLATDTTSSEAVIRHALSHYNETGIYYEKIVLLQPTSPLRDENHINEALTSYTKKLDMLVSVKETSSNPYYVLFEENKKGYLEKSKTGDFTRRQDCPKVWEYNGAIYVINVNSLQKKSISDFTKIKKYEMDDTSSIDIDTPLDWKIVELILNERNI
tara:strand:- start:3307 stop:3999 length:693 start_codon:yes stop_codon:yes gene_type:complete